MEVGLFSGCNLGGGSPILNLKMNELGKAITNLENGFNN